MWFEDGKSMNKKEFVNVFQIALLRKDGVGELEIRQLLVNVASNEEIQEGIKLCKQLNSLEIKK